MITRIFALSIVAGGLVLGCASSTGDADEPTEAAETTTSQPPAAPAKSAGVETQDAPLRTAVHICTGGDAPVHFWDACGSVSDYYPQGWHGWWESGESCGEVEVSAYYFHPDNGAHGGYIETWRLCND